MQELWRMRLKHSAEIDANLKQYRFADNMELIKKNIFPKER
jgi:hypothetical protein